MNPKKKSAKNANTRSHKLLHFFRTINEKNELTVCARKGILRGSVSEDGSESGTVGSSRHPQNRRSCNNCYAQI